MVLIGDHIEIVNGPTLLSKWVGDTEAAIRDVFERAQKFAPAVILFDEIDAIAPSRSAESAQHQVSVVAQLLVLLDGILPASSTTRPFLDELGAGF